MDELGRFYTNNIVSTLLINSMDTVAPKKIIDLGTGNASLTIAAYNRWSNAKFYATEIEANQVRDIKKNLSYVKIKNHNSLKIDLSSKLDLKLGSIDVAICNPPYVKVEKKKKYKKLFESVGMDACIGLKRLTSELVFFAQNLSLLRTDGEMGIIVSDSLIAGKDYRLFRETILNKFELKTIIQLPDKIFSKTEARTHILVLNKSTKRSDHCNLVLADEKGTFVNTLRVSKSELIERMDFNFWFYSLNNNVQTKTLKDIGAVIKRGYFSYVDLRKGTLPYFHSNKFPTRSRSLIFNQKVSAKNSNHVAIAGDILICRVGKRCVGRLARVKKGSILVSDCVYRISVPKKYQSTVWKAFSSIEGTAWLKAYAHGVCSQVICKSDLEKFPVLLHMKQLN